MDAISQSLPTVGAAAPQSQDAKTTLSADFETFLQMLTVQMQNQDPLNPVESSEFAVQLATFSSVEQQVRTNELLEGMAAYFAGDSLHAMADWIGMEALVQGPAVFDGNPVSVRYDTPEGADRVQLIVRDAAGNVVDQTALDPDNNRYTWNGSGLPHGVYSFSTVSRIDEVAAGETPIPVFVQIEEVRLEQGEPLLRMANGQELEPSLVFGMRMPVADTL